MGTGLCGPWQQSATGWNRPDSPLRVWAEYYGTERVFVENRRSVPVNLNGWIIRDSAISAYRTLSGLPVINPGEATRSTKASLNLNNLPADNRAFEGDAVYLMEPAGALKTGNLRAWFPYPCNPDNCEDPQKGRVEITGVQYWSHPSRSRALQVRWQRPPASTALARSRSAGHLPRIWAARRCRTP